MIKFVELFAGIGGFRYGLERCGLGVQETRNEGVGSPIRTRNSGKRESSRGESQRSVRFTCVWANEIDKYACQIYRKKYGKGELYEGDIRTVQPRDIPEAEMLVGGFPCQAFSIAGKRKGFEDTRGTLFYEIIRLARVNRYKTLLLENVKGLLNHENGSTFETIVRVLDEVGYDVEWEVLNSKNFGVPQNRERVFIVGHLRGRGRPQVFPIGGAYEQDNRAVQRYIGNALTARYEGAQATGTYVGEGKLNAQKIRRLTPTEAERLQGFPDGWTEGVSDTQRYKCLGNAVTTTVISEIGGKFNEKNPTKTEISQGQTRNPD